MCVWGGGGGGGGGVTVTQYFDYTPFPKVQTDLSALWAVREVAPSWKAAHPVPSPILKGAAKIHHINCTCLQVNATMLPYSGN